MAGRGNIEKRGAGWRVRYSDGTDDTGRRRVIRRTFPTRRDAERFLAELVIDAGDDQLEGRRFTLNQAIGHYFKVSRHAATYRYDLERAVDLIPDTYLELTVGRLRPADLRRLYDDLAATGRSPWRIHRVHEVIRGALGVAVRYEWITRNVADAATPPKPRRKTPTPPTSAQLDRLLELAGPDLRLWLRLAASTGARRGEIAGLRWCDVDLDTGVLRIRRAVSYAPGAGIVVGPTKTGEERRLALGPRIVAALDAHKADARHHANLAGVAWSDDRYIIAADPLGRTPWRPDRVTHAVARIRDAHPELAGVRLKELRHYVATQALAGGADVRTVAGRLGHRQTSTTVDIYAAFIPEADRRIADNLDR